MFCCYKPDSPGNRQFAGVAKDGKELVGPNTSVQEHICSMEVGFEIERPCLQEVESDPTFVARDSYQKVC